MFDPPLLILSVARSGVWLNNRADFYSLCLVSKSFYATAIRLLYRKLKISHETFEKSFTPLHAVLSSRQQERIFCLSAAEKHGLARSNGKGPEFGKALSNCGAFVREFEAALLVDDVEEDADIVKEILGSAIDNMSLLESFVWATPSDRALCRTPRISHSLIRKPRLNSLALSNIIETDAPLLRLHPLQSVTFILDSNFVSLAHRLLSSTADYDIIRKILRTSAGTLKSLTLISRPGGQRHYEDENLLFGGGEGDHKSVFKESPEGGEVTHLSRLKSLTLVGRPFTVKRLGVLTQAINFNNLRCLEIVSCPGTELLLSAITLPEARESGMGAESNEVGGSDTDSMSGSNEENGSGSDSDSGMESNKVDWSGLDSMWGSDEEDDPGSGMGAGWASEGGGESATGAEWASAGGNRAFPNLRKLVIRASQYEFGRFLKCFRGLQDLRYELGYDRRTWGLPEGGRRHIPCSLSVDSLLLARISMFHGHTLRKLTILTLDTLLCISERDLRGLARNCRVLVKLCFSARRFHFLFSTNPVKTRTRSNLWTLYLHLESGFSEFQARNCLQRLLLMIPNLKTVGMLTGKHSNEPYIFRVCPGRVLERVFDGDCLQSEFRASKFGD
ncbi:unnamed protein product [Tuber melanosporum]|uniref:(Perigord truffle) hypothetical protein n=1 Tax=Tuber melanosporum (strain Mel28) TaxID=656061 RepID=D5GGV7_TUBMM|nr:uncharacterized protein GSTUM_00002053001 [Tuber melanosporum]CAZ83750.1 unnamed protein product [Tuber melanosporum]